MKKNILMFVMLVVVLSMTSCMEYRYVYVPTSTTTSTVDGFSGGTQGNSAWAQQKRAEEARARAQMRQRQLEEQYNQAVGTVDQAISDIDGQIWRAQKRAEEARARAQMRRW